MSSTLALPAIRTAVLVLLRASVSLTTYVGARVYPDSNGDVPEKPTYPYVQVEGGSELPFNTMGASFGSEVRFGIRVATQTRSDSQADTITGIIKGVLDGTELSIAGYTAAMCEYDNLVQLKDSVGGVVTREWLSTYLVTASQ